MSQGWKGEHKRHKLAAKGIKTGRRMKFKRKTDVSYYDARLKDPDYAKRSDGEIVYIKYMRPKKYLRESAKLQRTSEGRQRELVNEDLVNEYKDRTERGSRMPMPYLDYGRREQEGRHRAVAAERMKAKKIPVLITKKMSPEEYDKYMERHHPDKYM